MLKAIVVDDSAYNRVTISKMLEETGFVQVVGTASDGQIAIKKVNDLKPDFVTLDLQMPNLDGFGFLRIAMKEFPIPVIVISSLSDSANVFTALELGAVDFIAKPGDSLTPELYNIKDSLRLKLEAIREITLKNIRKTVTARESNEPPRAIESSSHRIEVVAIGASTGGPSTLQNILVALPASFPAPILVAQHMPPGFTNAFAQRLNTHCPIRAKEAEDGEAVERGVVYIAPGGAHMTVAKDRTIGRISIGGRHLTDKYVPSIDALMNSVADAYGKGALGVILTGMGDDGKLGISRIKDKGGVTVAESEETAVIFGMPKVAIDTGKIDRILPFSGMAREIIDQTIGS